MEWPNSRKVQRISTSILAQALGKDWILKQICLPFLGMIELLLSWREQTLNTSLSVVD